MSIRTGLLSFVVVTFAFVLVLLVSFAELVEKHALERQLQELMQEKASNVMARTESVLGRAEFTAERTAALLAGGGVASRAGKSLERYLLYQVASSEHMTGMYVGWSNGDFLYVKGMRGPGDSRFRTLRVDSASEARRLWRDAGFALVSREPDIALDFDPRTRPWYARARDGGDTIWTEPYLFNTSRTPGITVAVPIRGDGDSIEAVVGIDMDIRLLSQLLDELPLPRRSEAVLATWDGKVVAAMEHMLGVDEAARGSELPRLEDLADGPLRAAFAARDRAATDSGTAEAGFFPLKRAGERYHAYFTRIPDSGRSWLLGLAVPDAAFLDALRQQRDLYLATVIILLVAGAVTALVIARALLHPIQELATIATEVREHGFGPQPHLRSRFREINDLSASLRRLLGRLEERQRENEGLNEQLRDLNRGLEREVSERTEELRRKNVELERLATTDSLTGALNRRAFMQGVEHEIERAARYPGGFSLAILDIDHFKRINDTHGHGFGDKVLTRLVAICGRELRGADLLGRIGGEEFAVLLPETGREAAVMTVERLRRALAHSPVPADDGTPVAFSVSIGVAEYVVGDDYQSLTARADRCLYRAKAEGRDRVCSSDETGP